MPGFFLEVHELTCYNVCMIKIEKNPETGPLWFPSDMNTAKRLVFFDIETTGLSAYSSSLYLIGALVFENGAARLLQWFAPSLSSEIGILRAFFDFLREDDLLVSFNGETFDINYLNACAKQYTMDSPLPGLRSMDILKMIRAYRKLMGLQNLRQKSIEQFLGIRREDRYSGGELIPVYESYGGTRDERLLHLLLLHNEEDLLGMPALLPALTYREAYGTPGRPSEIYRNKSGSRLYIRYSFDYRFPREISGADMNGIRFTFSENQLILEVPLIHEEMKYFFPNAKDYFYLPVEDRAIHKKLGRFVDKEFRIQAVPETCYTRRPGFFVPALKNSGFPCFRRSFDDPAAFHELDENNDFPEIYTKCFFESAGFSGSGETCVTRQREDTGDIIK